MKIVIPYGPCVVYTQIRLGLHDKTNYNSTTSTQTYINKGKSLLYYTHYS